MSYTETWISETPGNPSQRNLRIFADGAADSGIRSVIVHGQPGNEVLRTFTADRGGFPARCQSNVDLLLERIDVARFPLAITVEYCNEGYEVIPNILATVATGTGSPRSPVGCPPGSAPTPLCLDAISRLNGARSAVTTACEALRPARENLDSARLMYASFMVAYAIHLALLVAAFFIPIYGLIVASFLAIVVAWLLVSVGIALAFVWQYQREFERATARYNESLAAFNAEVQRVVNLCCPHHYRPEDLLCPACH